MKFFVLTLIGLFASNSFALESKVICSTIGEIGETNVFSITSATNLAIESLNGKIASEIKNNAVSVSAPTINVVPVVTEKLKETTVVACVTISKPMTSQGYPSNGVIGASFGIGHY